MVCGARLPTGRKIKQITHDHVPLLCTHWCGTAGLVMGLAPRNIGAALLPMPHACLAEGQSATTTLIVRQIVFIFKLAA